MSQDKRRALSRALLLASAILSAAGSAAPAAPQDVHERTVVLRLPGMEAVDVRSEVFALAGSQKLEMTVYRPSSSPRDERLPAVLFINGIGSLELPAWGQYTGWGRLAAASGLAGVTFQTYAAGAKDFEAAAAVSLGQAEGLLDFIKSNGPRLGLDPGRLAVWACSANVRNGFALLEEKHPADFRCGVLYYGTYSGRPRQDKPLLIARAGLDIYQLNGALDKLIHESLTLDAPVEVINLPSGRHGFDIQDDTEDSRAAVSKTLDFLKRHLAGPAGSRPARILTGTSLPELLKSGEREAAWALFRERLARLRSEKPADSLSFREISESGLVASGRDLLVDGRAAEAVEILKMAAEAYAGSKAVREGLAAAEEAVKKEKKTPGPFRGDHETSLMYAIVHAGPEPVSNLRPGTPWQIATLYTRAGKTEEAIDWLEKAFQAHDLNMPYLSVDPIFDDLRREPRFLDLLRRMKLPT